MVAQYVADLWLTAQLGFNEPLRMAHKGMAYRSAG